MPSPYPSNTTGISKSFIIVRRALLTIINDFDIPVVFEGYGEGMNDLREFQFEGYLDRLL